MQKNMSSNDGDGHMTLNNVVIADMNCDLKKIEALILYNSHRVW